MSLEYSQTGWDLSELFSSIDSPEIKNELDELEARVAEFESMRESLKTGLSKEAFTDLMDRLEDISRQAEQINAFAGLQFAEDTQNQQVLAFMAGIQETMAGLQNRVLFFDLWWKDLDDAEADRLMADAGDRVYWLEEIRSFKPYTLSEPEEKVINIKNVNGIEALTTLYDAITNKYVFNMEIDGRKEALTRGELMVYAHNPDPALREAAYRELYRVYGDEGPILGQMYQTIVRDWKSEQVDLRGHANPMAVRNLANDIPGEVVSVLLDVCRKNAGLFQRYFNLKARKLGLDRLRRYDIYAPVAGAEKTYDFDTAVRMVMDAFGQFDPVVADLALRVFKEGHIDSEVRKGKRDGAFCASVLPEQTPWVLINYQGQARDAATLAHELGHAVHSMLAADHSIFTFHACLPLAENASTFGEMLLVDYLLKEETDEAVRQDLLFRQMDDAYATIMRQAFFALFERDAHDMIREGATVDQLAEAYFQNLADQFGDVIEVGDEFRWEWVSIPHIYHSPFYVYAYSFGQLLVFALYRQYKEDKESFLPRYLKILSAGGSVAPEKLLKDAGLDIRSPEFWEGGFEVVRDLLDKLEALPGLGG